LVGALVVGAFVSDEADRIEMDGYIEGAEQVAAAGLLAAEERNFGYAAGAYGRAEAAEPTGLEHTPPGFGSNRGPSDQAAAGKRRHLRLRAAAPVTKRRPLSSRFSYENKRILYK